jgi:predicted O-linked N-acetylglucosamine transferase (SPINDLY family)
MNLNKVYRLQMRNYSKYSYYNHLLKIINISDHEKKTIEKSNFSFNNIYSLLEKNNQLIYIFFFIFYPFSKFNNLEEEKKYRKLFEHNIDFCINNVPKKIFEQIDIKYLKFIFKQNFYLAYTNLNNKRLLEKINILFSKNTKIFTDLSNYKHTFQKKNKIKIGIVCNQIFNLNKPVSRDRSKIILNLDRNIFDIHLITNLSKNRSSIPVFNKYPKIICSGKNCVNILLSQNFDILFYPEIGMDIFTFICGSHRLAPIQISTWGHSETTGMKSMDYYISSKYFNNEKDQKYFSEKLVLLNSLGTYYIPMKNTIDNVDKQKIYKLFKIDPNKNIYNSLQTPSKICSYEFLNIVKKILSNDPNGIFITLYFTTIEKNFIINNLDSYKNQVRLFRYQSRTNYQKLLTISSILLDPFPFGSLNTSLDAFIFGKIVLTMPSNKINGNFCTGFYKKMEILEPISNSSEEYINKALKFVNDNDFRKKIEKKIKEKCNVLFYEKESITEYNTLFRNIYEKNSGFKLENNNNINNSLKYTNMHKIITDKPILYRVYTTKDKNKVYVDQYNIVWLLENNVLISDGMLFGNTIYNKTNIYYTVKMLSRNNLPYPRYVPIIEINYNKKIININPKGDEIITWMIAVYNRKHIIKDTIDSLLNQTESNWKCIICDDGSTDGSYEYIKSYINDDDRFTLYEKENSGYVQTCRFMHDKVNTDVVAILDSDDVLEPKTNEILINRFRKEKCSAIYTGYYLCNNNLKIRRKIIPKMMNKDLLIKNPFEHIRSWRKNCLPCGSFPKFLIGAEDQDLAYRFEEQGIDNILIEKSPLTKIRHTNNSLMRNEKTRIEARINHYIAKMAALNRRYYKKT